MGTSRNESVKVQLPILGLLGIAFIVLKLTKVISWSWWWVTAPFWAPVAIAIVVVFALFLLAIAVAILEGRSKT